MKRRIALALGLLLAACEQQPEAASTDDAAASAELEIDPVLLRELLGESVRVEGDQIRADGMLIRLAFDPLIRQTGPVSVQLVQGQGYRLSGIADGSPLWLLGLRDGDVLTGVDKQAIIGREHELRSTYESRPSRVELTYMRGSEAHTVVVRIASGSAWRSSASAADLPLPSTAVERVSPLDRPQPEAVVELAKGLRCVASSSLDGIDSCELERAALDKVLANPETLARQARIVPAVREGETLGYKLYGIRPNSITKLLGFKNGDMIISVNGRRLESLDAAMATYTALRDEKEFRVAYERRGEQRELEIVIVDVLSGPATGLGGEDEAERDPAPPDPKTGLRDPFHGR